MRIPHFSPRARLALRYLATGIIVAVVGFFFWRSLASNWDQVIALDLRVSWLTVLAVGVFAIAVPASGFLWGQMLRWLAPGTQLSTIDIVATQCQSWLLKYIPGQLGSFASKVLWAQSRGISRTLVSITFIYENVFLQIASIVPSVLILLISFGSAIFLDNFYVLVVPLLVAIPLVIVSNRKIFHLIAQRILQRTVKRELAIDLFLSSRQSLVLQAEFLIPRVLNGAGFLLVAASILDVPEGSWLPLAAAYVLGGAFGILAFFVPSGIGVREAVIVLIASQYLPTEQAVVLALVSRLVATIADVVVAAFYLALRLIQKKGELPA